MVDYTQDVSKLSAGQLGESLLAQKNARDTADRKKARRNDKIQGALVLALAGKGFARNAYNKRKEELDKIQTFQAKNNEAQAKEIANVSSILSIIPENYMSNEKDANKKAKAFMNDYSGEFSGKLNTYVDNKIKNSLGGDTTAYNEFRASPQYNSVMRTAGENLMTEWFTDDNYKKYENELRKALGEQDLDRTTLLKKSMGITTDELTAIEANHYSNILSGLKEKDTIMSGYKRVLEKAGLKDEEKGGVNLFKSLDKSMNGPSLDAALKAMNLNGNFNYVVDKAIASAKTSNENYSIKMQGKNQEDYAVRIAETYLPNMAELIEDGEYKDQVTGDIQFISKNQMETFMDTIINSEDESKKRIFVNDVGAVALKLRDEPKFVTNIYKSIYGAEEQPSLSFAEFKSRMANEETRTQFAAGLVLENGLTQKNGFLYGISEVNYSGKNINQIYDRGIIPSLIGEGINMPTKENIEFTVPNDYDNLSLIVKRNDFDATYKQIQKIPVSEKQKELLIIKLFKEIGNPDGLNKEEYLIDLKTREEKEKELYEKRIKDEKFFNSEFKEKLLKKSLQLII